MTESELRGFYHRYMLIDRTTTCTIPPTSVAG
jgi:hypothetical protein